MIPPRGTVSAGLGEVELGSPETPTRDSVPVSEYIRGTFVPLSNLAHGWQLHAAVSLTPAEERTMVREPAQAVPASIAQRLGALRVLIVPYIACFDTGDVIAFTKPKGETHSAVWLEDPERIHLLLPCRELDAHDTGFEFLASIAELLRPRLRPEEVGRYTALLEEELQVGVRAEIDEEALGASAACSARAFGAIAIWNSSSVTATSLWFRPRPSTCTASGTTSKFAWDPTTFPCPSFAGAWTCWPNSFRQTPAFRSSRQNSRKRNSKRRGSKEAALHG